LNGEAGPLAMGTGMAACALLAWLTLRRLASAAEA
jgi:hypothetical protein